jgi:hypothetical protein
MAAMAVIEERLAVPKPRLAEDISGSNGICKPKSFMDTTHLICLVTALDASALDEKQRELVAALRGGITALASQG